MQFDKENAAAAAAGGGSDGANGFYRIKGLLFMMYLERFYLLKQIL